MWFYTVVCIGCAVSFHHVSHPLFPDQASCEFAAVDYAKAMHYTDNHDYGYACILDPTAEKDYEPKKLLP